MGMCSYCLRSSRDECFGWDEARGCSGITGPDDPVYLQRKADRRLEQARELRRLADECEAEAIKRADESRSYATRLEMEHASIVAQLVGQHP